MSESNILFVLKRNNVLQIFNKEKIKQRLEKLLIVEFILDNIDLDIIINKVILSIYDKISTKLLDEISAETCAYMNILHPNYSILAARISVSNLHKETHESFYETMRLLCEEGILNQLVFKSIEENKEIIEKTINYNKDYTYDYFGFKTLSKSYLLKINNKIVERPQDMIMRVSVGIHVNDIKSVIETYKYMSDKYFTHATPTLFNSGTKNNQLSSCFLLTMKEDSISGIFDTLKQCALISKSAGGIGLSIHDIRSKDSLIKGTNGISNGIVPMLKVFNETARYVDQCFSKDTIIYTKNGIKTIDKLQVGEEVITLNGDFNKINKILKYECNESMYKLKTYQTSNDKLVTSKHPFYCLKNRDDNYKDLINKLEHKMIKPEYIELENITKDDYIGYPIMKYNKDIEKLTIDDCILYGILLASNINISDNKLKIYNLDNLQMDKYLLSTTFIYNVEYINNYKIYKFNLNELNLYILNLLEINNNEIIFNSKLLYLPLNKILKIIKGIHYGNNNVDIKNYEFYKSTNNDNIESIKFLLLRNSCGSIVNKKFINNNIYNIIYSPYIYGISLFESNENPLFDNINKPLFILYDNILYSKVEYIDKSNYYFDYLYDLEIDTNHNYLTELGLCHNGGGKRRGSIAVYIEPWHADIEDFLQLKKNNGKEEMRARDLFYALWIPDLFMERVQNNEQWSLMCPNQSSNLCNLYGDQFKQKYIEYEQNNRYIKKINARDLFNKIIESQIETGTPYMLYKDACNIKSNQKNLGTIRSSNLCVSPDTYILSDKGYHKIKFLYDIYKKVKIWNGFEYSKVNIVKTGEKQEMIKVFFSNGNILECTPYHKFYINDNKEYIEAKELECGMKINNYNLPVIDNIEDQLLFPYLHGLLSSYSYTKGYNMLNLRIIVGIKTTYLKIDVNENIFNKIKNFVFKYEKINNIYSCIINNKYIELPKFLSIINEFNLSKEDVKQNLTPMNSSLKCKLEWLRGLYDICGYIKNNIIYILNENYYLLIQTQYLLQTLGIQSNVIKLDKYLFNLEICYSKSLNDLGLNINENLIDINFNLYVTKIDISLDSDTYCFNDYKNHTGIFNGIYAGNCSEIIEYTSPNEVAVCNLASISLPNFVNNDLTFDYDKLIEITKVITRNLNKVIDINYYPVDEAKNSNLQHRPIGIGIQGLADTFIKLRIPYDSEEANVINEKIFETIYYASCYESNQIAKVNGYYSSFIGSPSSKGILQFDLWNYKPINNYDWDSLKASIITYGLRNSLLIALMPTASTSQILGNTESFEALTSNLYVRRVLSGEFICTNQYLVKDLIKLNLWNQDIRNKLIQYNGSIQDIDEIPDNIKQLYKIVWEISQKKIVDMAIRRSPFIDQSQSLNIFMAEPNVQKLTSLHFYTWKNGLKTGMYYLRSKPASDTIKFTLDIEDKKVKKENSKFECIGCGA